jgi:hypothetical protein
MVRAMLRQIGKLVLMCLLIVGGAYGLYRYEKSRSSEARLQQEIEKLEEQRRHLQDFVQRLTSERRVAEVLVSEQSQNGDRIEKTTLLFVEYGRDGRQLPPKFFTIQGNVAHIDALVIKFDRGFMEQDDPLRGQSLVLFYRLFGDYQAPADGYRIDEPGRSPEIYKGDATLSPAAQAFEAELWRDFWKLADDPKYREEKGVRVAQGESPWTYFYPDKIYTVKLEAAGGLSLTSRPIEGIWMELREALMRQRLTAGTPR